MINFKYGIEDVPKKKSEHLLLSVQHVFAMFGSTILVPILIGLDVSVAIFCAGMGTLIYSFTTKQKVPVFIGSSFAYISLLGALMQTEGRSGVAFAVICVGILYVLISLITMMIGVKWLDYVLPAVVMGPLVIVIGLSLAPIAMANSGLSIDNFNFKSVIVALITLLATLFALEKGNSFIKSVPILIGIFVGYIAAFILGIVDLSSFENLQFFKVPEFNIILIDGNFKFNSSILLAVIPLVIVTIAEHIGDHTVGSAITGRNFLKDPGLKRTILGDGLATLCAGIIGGPVNTTYAENTGVIILTKVASIKVIQLAGVFAMLIAFINPIAIFISTIPTPVMGGISIVLFGLIAQNGVRILMNARIDFNHTRNMIIVAVILVVGLGGGYFAFNLFNTQFVFQGMSLAAIFGIGIHLVLPDKHLSLKPDATLADEMIEDDLI
ncbi:MAG: uracil-xanthine permease family protein [Bacilli bacterium]